MVHSLTSPDDHESDQERGTSSKKIRQVNSTDVSPNSFGPQWCKSCTTGYNNCPRMAEEG